MSIQYFINRATAIDISRRKVTGVQYTRSEVARTETTVTKNPWRISVTIAPMAWLDARPYLEAIDQLDRTTPETVLFNGTNTAFLYGYLGDRATTPTTFTVTSFSGNQLVVGNLSGLTAGQIAFRAGDLVQIAGKPNPYTIVSNVTYTGAETITLTTHRPNISSGSVVGLGLNVGPNCQFNMFCPNMPVYGLIPGAFRRTANGTYTNGAIVEFAEPLQLVEWTYGT